MDSSRGVVVQFMLDRVAQRAPIMLNGPSCDLILKTTEVSLGEKEM